VQQRGIADRLAADLIEGTCFFGSIPTQEAKALRYRTISEKEKISAQISASAIRGRVIGVNGIGT